MAHDPERRPNEPLTTDDRPPIATGAPSVPSRSRRLHDRRAETIKVFAELGFVDLLVRSGLWQHAPAKLKVRGLTETSSGGADQPDQPARLRRALERLGGAFVKLGQMLSVRPDMLPPSYVAELEKLQDKIAPLSFETIQEAVESELERTLDQAFAVFDPQPLGSASLAQVHAAELHDGTRVVVKVQRPGCRSLVDLDLELMARAARKLAGTPWGKDFDPVGFVAEFDRALRSELDLTSEARTLDVFGEFFADDAGVEVPSVFWDRTTSRVLTESHLDGIPLSRPDDFRASGGDIPRVVRRGVEAYLRMVFELHRFHSDPHPGNLLAMPGDVLGFLDFGRVSSLSERARDRAAAYLIALAQDDAEGVTDVLLEMANASADVDRRELRGEIEEMMARYAGADVSDTAGKTVMVEMIVIARRHRLRLPSEYTMLMLTLGMLHGVVLKLDPHTKLLEVAQPFIRRAAISRLPERASREFTRLLRRYGRLLERMPEAFDGALRRLALGELCVKIKFEDSAEVLDRAEAIANRFSFTLLLSAVTIALALVAAQMVPGWVRDGAHLLLFFVVLVAAWHVVSIVSAETRSRRRKERAG